MKMRNMSKNALAVAVGAGLVAVPVLSAQAFEVGVSGQVNRTVKQLDNGDDSSIFHSDNDSSSSRIRVTGSGDYGTGTAGFIIEHQFESGGSNFDDLPNVSDGGNTDSLRKAEVYMSYDWGKISVGQGSTATDGATENDLGGGAWAGGVYPYPVDMMAGVNWVNSAGVRIGTLLPSPTSFTVGSAISSFDGGRADRLRYDSPAFGPLSFTGSIGNGESLELAVAGSHEFGQSKFVWTVATADAGDLGSSTTTAAGVIEADNEDPSRTLASAALQIGSFDFQFSTGELDRDICTGFGCTGVVTGPGGNDKDPEATYLSAGFTTGGGHHFRVGIQETTDFAANEVDGEVTQVGWGYAPNDSVDVYASWTEAELDASAAAIAGLGLPAGTSAEDVTAFLVGVRVKFK